MKSVRRSSITRSIQNSNILSLTLVDDKTQMPIPEKNESSLQQLSHKSKLFEQPIPIPKQINCNMMANNHQLQPKASIPNVSDKIQSSPKTPR